MTEILLSDVPEMIAKHNSKLGIMLVGKPGIGKTEIVKQAAAILDRPYVPIYPALLDFTDFNGIPFLSGDFSKFAPNEMFKDIPKCALVFLDELNRALKQTQNAALRFALEKIVGTTHLPDDVTVLSACNPPGNGNDVYPLSSPLLDRFIVVHVRPNYEDWIAWGVQKGLRSEVLGFINSFPEWLDKDMPEDCPSDSLGAWTSPRSLETTSDILNEGNSDRVERAKIEGTIGAPAAIQFATYRALAHRLSDPAEVLDGVARFPDEPDLQIMTVMGVMKVLHERMAAEKPKEVDSLLAYFTRIQDRSLGWPPEVVATTVSISRRSELFKAKFAISYKRKDKITMYAMRESDSAQLLREALAGG